MDASKKKTNPHPLETANCLSEVTFWWTIREFIRGYSRDLEADDLYEPLKDHKSDRLGNILEKNWNTELKSPNGGKKPHPSFMRAMVKSFGPRFMCFGFVLLFVELVVKVAQPIFLGRLIRYFTPSSGISKQEAYLYALGVIASSGISTVILHPYMMGIMHMGMQMRVAACSLIYRKALRLSHSAMGLTTAGQVVNLLSNDVNRFDVVPIFMHYLWVGPIETVICSYLMWSEMGLSALFGIAMLLLTIPLQGYLGKKTSSIRMKTAVRTDERVRLMNEIISGIQVIKMYTWEKPFAKLVSLARRYEIRQIKLSSYIRGVYLSFIMFTTRVTLFVSVISYVLFGNQITAEKVFVMTSFYNIVRQTMTIFFPQAISQLAEGSVSIKRLQSFLLLDEVSGSSHSSACTNGGKPKEVEVCLQGAKAQWNFEMADPTLAGVNLKVTSGQLVAVIGPVGAGKTSLIHAILGELPLSAGTIQVSGSLSYAAQEPWLFAGSLRQNITFGQNWNAARYREVIRVCALETDLAQLPYGDRTIVGERGVSLSGGQRARVSLARAVYKEADIYLLDDPLSAVDAHVGRHLFDDCIRGFLKHKAVVLVTHQLQFLNQASHIIILNNGHIEAEGTYSELQASGLDFGQLLEELREETDVDTDLTDKEEERRVRDGSSSRRSSEGSTASHLEGLLRQISIKSMRSSQELETSKSVKVPQEVAEIRSTGTVSGEVYSKYFSAGGNCCVIFTMFALFFLAQLAGSGADYWVTYWTNWEESRSNKSEIVLASFNESTFNNTEGATYESDSWLTTELCIYIYSGTIGAVLLISIIRSFVFFNTCMRASVRLHDSMFSAITRATMAFFNNNPSGRILNRFSKDMGAIDEMLPAAMIDALQIGLTLTGIIVVVAIVNYWLLIPTGVIAVVFYFMRVVYITTSRSVKRLEGITRSPVFTHLNASIQGLSTIRAFRAQKLLETQFDGHQDLHSSAWYLFISTSRAFGYWLDVICFFYIALVTLSFLVLGNEFGGNVGLAITQAIGLTGMFQWGMRQSAELENQMTSVERVLEFSKLDSEPPLTTERKNAPPKDWPMKGEVKFDKLSLRYSPSDPSVLKQISFTVNPGEKVGIVGRTGAGKSSLISALFRLAECHEGCILIDGVDTSSLGLHQLRSSISIIPQEPVLFSGTMRKNLDPFDDYPDAVLWKALEEVELRDAVTDLPGGLSAHMSEGGSNFSVGQRQLVCLARAIVRKNRILVLDEATANVDPKTDALIQNTIRRKFAQCTVLTIAHRLHTIMDADRVLVMEAGRVAEFAPPSDLLADPDSILSRLAEQTGHANATNLRHRASLARPEQM